MLDGEREIGGERAATPVLGMGAAMPRGRMLRHLPGGALSSALVLSALVAFGPATARAQAQTPPPVASPAAPLPRPDQARGLAEAPGIEPEDVALFVPRAILFLPARAVGFVSAPVRQAMRAIEKHHVLERIEDFFYNDARTAAIVPVVTLSTFLGAQIGLRAFHDDLGGHGESGAVKVSLGADWEQLYLLSFRADRLGGTPLWVESKTVYEDHPSLRFYGLGGDADATFTGDHLDPRGASAESFYSQRRFRQLLTVGATLGRPGLVAQVGGRGRFKSSSFDRARGLAEGDRDLEDVYDASAVAGYDDGERVLETEAVAILDVRDPTRASGHAFHGEAFGGGALPFRDDYYGHFGAELTGYIDLYHTDRVLVLRAAFEAVEGDAAHIPFVELPSLGGPHRLRGYPLHRFRDEKAFVGTIEYQYPIHQNIAGTFFFDFGEVSPDYVQLVTSPRFAVGGGGGLIVKNKDKVTLSLEVAGGEGVQVLFTTDPLRAFADRDDEL